MSTILSVAMYFIRTYISRSGWKEEGAEDKGKRKNLPHKSQHKIVPIALRSLFVFPASLLSLSLSHRLGKWKIALMEKACQRGEAHVAFYIQWKLRGWIFIIDYRKKLFFSSFSGSAKANFLRGNFLFLSFPPPPLVTLRNGALLLLLRYFMPWESHKRVKGESRKACDLDECFRLRRDFNPEKKHSRDLLRHLNVNHQ